MMSTNWGVKRLTVCQSGGERGCDGSVVVDANKSVEVK